ncbi:hypothetical protein [Rhodococcus sp. NPDC049939]|uniref:hypothetical protein n=1 Tax=Rhodococcus sp. NPDC049939 TaxID=3155511 RepID=UPI0033D39032
MKNSVRTAATAVLAAPLVAAVFAAPANAAPGDVRLSTGLQGNNFTFTFFNDSPNQVECDWFVDSATTQRTFSGVVRAESQSEYTLGGVADGDYQVTWFCTDTSGNQWGTDGLSNPPTASPETFTVGELPGNPGNPGGPGGMGSLDFGF